MNKQEGMNKQVNPWKFDYHAMDEDFLKWLIIATVPAQDKEVFDELSEATNGFTEVEIGMTMNGVPVDPLRLLGYLERALEHKAEKHAEALVENIFPTFENLQEKIVEAEKDILATVRETLTDAGIVLRRFNDYDDD